MHPDLPVLERLPDVFLVILFGKRATIHVQTAVHFVALLLSEELGGVPANSIRTIRHDSQHHIAHG